MSNREEGVGVREMLLPRQPERRGDQRRVGDERRFAERRAPVRAAAGRRVIHPFERRIAERRMLERRSIWPETSN
jgi:hypothetical protein